MYLVHLNFCGKGMSIRNTDIIKNKFQSSWLLRTTEKAEEGEEEKESSETKPTKR